MFGPRAWCLKFKTVLIPLPPAVAHAIDRAVDGRDHGPILRNTYGTRMDRRAATRRLKQMADAAGKDRPDASPHVAAHIRDHDAHAGVSLLGQPYFVT